MAEILDVDDIEGLSKDCLVISLVDPCLKTALHSNHPSLDIKHKLPHSLLQSHASSPCNSPDIFC